MHPQPGVVENLLNAHEGLPVIGRAGLHDVGHETGDPFGLRRGGGDVAGGRDGPGIAGQRCSGGAGQVGPAGDRLTDETAQAGQQADRVGIESVALSRADLEYPHRLAAPPAGPLAATHERHADHRGHANAAARGTIDPGVTLSISAGQHLTGGDRKAGQAACRREPQSDTAAQSAAGTHVGEHAISGQLDHGALRGGDHCQ